MAIASSAIADDMRHIKEDNPFESMMSRFDRAAQLLDLDPDLYAVMRVPNRELQVYLAIVWHEVRDRILADAALPASAIRSQLQASINNVGLALLRDQPMQEKFNVWLRNEIVDG